MDTRWTAVFFVSILLFSSPAFADSASANRQTTFNDTTDYLATVGKSPEDKKDILQERREIRRHARLKDEERRKRAATRQRIKAEQENIMRKIQATQ